MGNLCFPSEQVDEAKADKVQQQTQQAQQPTASNIPRQSVSGSWFDPALEKPMDIGRPEPITLEQALGLEKRPDNIGDASASTSSRPQSDLSHLSLEDVLRLRDDDDITVKVVRRTSSDSGVATDIKSSEAFDSALMDSTPENDESILHLPENKNRRRSSAIADTIDFSAQHRALQPKVDEKPETEEEKAEEKEVETVEKDHDQFISDLAEKFPDLVEGKGKEDGKGKEKEQERAPIEASESKPELSDFDNSSNVTVATADMTDISKLLADRQPEEEKTGPSDSKAVMKASKKKRRSKGSLRLKF